MESTAESRTASSDLGQTTGRLEDAVENMGNNSSRNYALQVREQRQLQRRTLQLMGRPYLVKFFGLTWVLSILLGAVLGLGSFLILESSSFLNRELSHITNHLSFLMVAIRSILGGLFSGIFLWALPWSPKNDRQFYHDLIDLEPKLQCLQHRFCTILAGWILLLLGAPLGPELVLGTLATSLVSLLASFNAWFSRRRRVASWMQASVAGALACSFPSFVGNLLALQELVATARPHDTTVDAALQRRRQRNGDNESSNNDDESEEHTLQVPLWRRADNIFPHQQRSSSLDHDVLELLLLSASVTFCSSTVLQSLSHWVDCHSQHAKTILLNDFQGSLQPHHDTTKLVNYLVALLLGVLCGIVGCLIVLLVAAFQWIRSKACRWLQRHRWPSWCGPVALSCLAGCIVFFLALPLPEAWMGMDNGICLSLHLLKQKDSVGVLQLVGIVVCRSISLAVVLGFGWFGGPVFPLASIGLSLGLILSKIIPVLSDSFTVPCCMVAVMGSILPCPFALVTTILQLFGLGLDHGGALLVAVVAAHAVTGGSGIIRYCGQRLIGVQSGYSSEEEAEEELAERLMASPSDDEILRDIRSAIFGGLARESLA